MEDKKLEKLENKVQASFDSLNSKLDSYNQKLNEVIPIINNTNNIVNKKEFKISMNMMNIKFIIPILIVIFLVVYGVLYLISPKFICSEYLNKETHFKEQKINLFKHILFSLAISIILEFCIIFTYYIINMKR